MLSIKASIFAVAAALFLYSCGCPEPINGCPEDYEPYKEREIRVFRKIDKTDMLFGTTRVFNASQIKVYTLHGADTTFLKATPVKVLALNSYQTDSALLIRFIPLPEVAYMRFENGDIDTLNIIKRIDKTRCCDPLTKIGNLELNGVPGKNEWGWFELEK